MIRSTGALAALAGRLAAADAGATAARRLLQRAALSSGPAPAPSASSTSSAAAAAADPETSPLPSGDGGDTPGSPSPEPIALLLRKLGLSKTLVKRSVADRAGLLDLVSAGLRTARAHLSVSLTRKAVETSFDGREFLEGALGAYHAVHAAAAAQDWAALEGMTTPAIADAARRLTAAAAAEGLAVSLEVDPSVRAEIDTMVLMGPALVGATASGERDPASAGNEGEEEGGGGGGEEGGARDDGGASAAASHASDDSDDTPGWQPELVGRHQGLHVRFSGGGVTLRLAACRGAAATAAAAGLAAPPEEESTTVLEVTDRRARTWVFERGPLPPGLPVRDMSGELAWRVLAIEG